MRLKPFEYKRGLLKFFATRESRPADPDAIHPYKWLPRYDDLRAFLIRSN